MSAFNLADALAAAGVNVDTGNRMQIEHISIDLIVSDEKNFYELSDLEDLAASIACVGLQQPLLVRPMPGDDSKVIIISGHRRYNALKLLAEQDGRDDLRDVPCIVGPADENPKLTQLKLIMANSTARKLSSSDLAKQAEQIEELLYQLKEDGMEFPGRMRDHVAEACKVSTGKLARVKLIRSSLILQFMRLWESGKLPDNAAEVLAKETPRFQKAFFLAQTQDYTKSFDCHASWISAVMREMHNVEDVCRHTVCEKNFVTSCDHVHTRLDHAAGLRQYESMSCRGCCCSCSWLASCKYSCEYAADEKKRQKDAVRQQRQESARAVEEQNKPQTDLVKAAYSRIAHLRTTKGIEAKDFIKASKDYCFSDDADRLEKLEHGAKPSGKDRMPGGIWPADALRLIRTAEMLGCSIDYMLGRDASPEPEKAEPLACWQTGTPADRGYYAVAYRRQPGGPLFYRNAYWSGRKWEQLDSLIVALCWMPAPEVD